MVPGDRSDPYGKQAGSTGTPAGWLVNRDSILLVGKAGVDSRPAALARAAGLV
jgi:hypothetical protein